VTPAADSYALGSTFYQMVTGRSPTELVPPTPAQGNRSVLFDRWDWAALNGKVGAGTYNFIRNCLDPRPGNRPQRGEELHRAIGQLLK
jgi:serine/threonine protein kinase